MWLGLVAVVAWTAVCVMVGVAVGLRIRDRAREDFDVLGPRLVCRRCCGYGLVRDADSVTIPCPDCACTAEPSTVMSHLEPAGLLQAWLTKVTLSHHQPYDVARDPSNPHLKCLTCRADWPCAEFIRLAEERP